MKDAVGNELREGDLVALQLERPLIFGRVTSIERGGIITGIRGKGEAEIRPDRIVIVSSHPLAVDPRLPVGAVICIRDDSASRAELIDGPSSSPPLSN